MQSPPTASVLLPAPHVAMDMEPGLVEAYLLIEQPRQRLGHWSKSLAALDSPLAPPLTEVIASYDPTCDQAVLRLAYDARVLGDHGLVYAINVALLAEVGMVQPHELSDGERARFLSTRLSRCTIQVTDEKAAVPALAELVRRIKEDRAPVRKPVSPPPIPPRQSGAVTPSLAPRGGRPEPDAQITARGTRDDLEHVRDEVGRLRAPTAELSPRVAHVLASSSGHDDEDDRITTPMTLDALQAIASRSAPPVPPPLPPPDSGPIAATASLAPRAVTPAATSRRPARKVSALSEPYLPTTTQQPDVIYARYLRGGRWVPVRVGALSLKGAALLTGALPRLSDRVDVALTFGAHRALVRGTVAKVSSVREAASTGAATFSLAFELDEVSRKQLTTLLLAARDAKITIKPPPPRSNRRFPVEWRMALGTTKGAVKATALDVSTGGMFVQPSLALELGAVVSFSIVLDDGGSPVSGRARVIRRVTEAEARTCGLMPGFGLGVVEMNESDRMRWLGFLARIERRADKRVLIGATPERLAELQAGLASVGYAVVGGTDPGTLVQLAGSNARPADAVLIDAGWLRNEASTALVESLFTARNVPCVTMHGEPRRARQAIDRLLEVVV